MRRRTVNHASKTLAGLLFLVPWFAATPAIAVTADLDLSSCGSMGSSTSICNIEFTGIQSDTTGEIWLDFVHEQTPDVSLKILQGDSIIFESVGEDGVAQSIGALVPLDASIADADGPITAVDVTKGVPEINCDHCVAFTAQKDIFIRQLHYVFSAESLLYGLDLIGGNYYDVFPGSREFQIAVPEPSALGLLAAGLIGLAAPRRRHRSPRCLEPTVEGGRLHYV